MSGQLDVDHLGVRPPRAKRSSRTLPDACRRAERRNEYDERPLPVVHPLIAPEVMPATICLLKKMNMMSGGMVISSTFVKSRFHDV